MSKENGRLMGKDLKLEPMSVKIVDLHKEEKADFGTAWGVVAYTQGEKGFMSILPSSYWDYKEYCQAVVIEVPKEEALRMLAEIQDMNQDQMAERPTVDKWSPVENEERMKQWGY